MDLQDQLKNLFPDHVPEVPTRTMFSDVNCSFGCLVFKSMFTKASNSFKTISILSGPIPVEITVKRFPL